MKTIKTLTAALVALIAAGAGAADLPKRVLELPPSRTNPRNSEGDFVKLKDGAILYIYTHYNGKGAGDHDAASLVSRISRDGGRTWSKKDRHEISNHGGMNVMSVSLLRLDDGRLALFYLLKNSTDDCRPVMRVSEDEGKSWSAPRTCISDDDIGYYVLNNARAIQLSSGRIVLPLSRHKRKGMTKSSAAGEIMTLLSDDSGKTWRFGKDVLVTRTLDGRLVTTQEPGVLELKDGRLIMWMRTTDHTQFVTWSKDGGDTWTRAVPWNLNSPNSPATVERLSNGDLVAIWNDHGGHPEFKNPEFMAPRYKGTGKWSNGQRTPLTLAVSKDEGVSWIFRRDLECAPDGWFCYIAALEADGALLLGYCSKDNLAASRITRVPLAWLYGPPRADDTTGFFRD